MLIVHPYDRKKYQIKFCKGEGNMQECKIQNIKYIFVERKKNGKCTNRRIYKV